MKIIVLTILFLLALAPTVKGQDCDCTITPFKPEPPCYSKCRSALRLLARANMEELQRILGLEEDTAQKIVGLKGRSHAKTLRDYSVVLTDQEIATIAEKINSLSASQLTYPTSVRRRRGRRRQ